MQTRCRSDGRPRPNNWLDCPPLECNGQWDSSWWRWNRSHLPKLSLIASYDAERARAVLEQFVRLIAALPESFSSTRQLTFFCARVRYALSGTEVT